MNLIKTILSLTILCSLAQAAHKNHALVTSQSSDTTVKKNNRANSCCCSCIKTALIATTITCMTVLAIDSYEHQLLYADIQNLPTKMDNCITNCPEPDEPCYQSCAQEIFSENNTNFIGSSTTKFYRKNLNRMHEHCVQNWRKKNNPQTSFTNKECTQKVLDRALKDQKHDGLYELPDDAILRPINLLDMIKFAWIAITNV
jgi:hypothetical protein